MTAVTSPDRPAALGARHIPTCRRGRWDPRGLVAPDADAGARPRWFRPAFTALLLATAALYLWGLSASGWANAFYSAAAQAGGDNWTAFLFGSSDIGNSITVDKPPASIWVMALSVRAFGLNSWSLLIPEALMGVGAVALLVLTVRRWFGAAAGLLSGVTLALTPAAVLMFRFNNPDALLVLLLVASAFAVTRALEAGRTRWLVLAGVLVGIAFLTKSLQALLVLPGFVAAYLWAAPVSLGRRIRALLAAFVAMAAAGGWWVALVEVWPTDSRPYVGGSQTNSALELILGYNGLGRITGDEAGSVVPGGGAGAGGGWGATGWHRMFDADWAGGIAWLLPTAAVLMVIGFWVSRSLPRTSRTRAALVLWGGWLLVTWATFSFAAGIIHEYYAVALAPATAALVGIGGKLLWDLRDKFLGRVVLAAVTLATAWYGAGLLTSAAGGYAVLGAVVAAGAVLVGLVLITSRGGSAVAAAVAAAVLVLLGPAAFAVQTAATPHAGSLPTAGPQLAGDRGGFGVGRGGPGGMPQGAPPATGAAAPPSASTGANAGTGGPSRVGGPSGAGGLLNASEPGSELLALLTANADDFTWVAAAVGSQNSAGYQLASGASVMPIGGFNGSDPSPTLVQFQQHVADGRIHYFLGSDGGGMGGTGGPGGSNEIAEWVAENFTATTVDGVTVYDLTAGSAS